MLRPNEAALTALAKVRTLPIGGDEHANACVAMYVRHGDKHSEMKLVRSLSLCLSLNYHLNSIFHSLFYIAFIVYIMYVILTVIHLPTLSLSVYVFASGGVPRVRKDL